jgi:hypothetical protein
MEKRCELYMDRKSLKYIFTQLDFNFGAMKKVGAYQDYDL